jgi:hypothetical protein
VYDLICISSDSDKELADEAGELITKNWYRDREYISGDEIALVEIALSNAEYFDRAAYGVLQFVEGLTGDATFEPPLRLTLEESGIDVGRLLDAKDPAEAIEVLCASTDRRRDASEEN